MNDLIKTGEEIFDEIGLEWHEERKNELYKKQWVLLYLLREKIKEKQKRINLSSDAKFRADCNVSLDWVLSLINKDE